MGKIKIFYLNVRLRSPIFDPLSSAVDKPCYLAVIAKPLVSDSLFASVYRCFCYYYHTTFHAHIMSSGDYEAVDECDGNFDPDPEDSSDFNLNPWWVNSNCCLSSLT